MPRDALEKHFAYRGWKVRLWEEGLAWWAQAERRGLVAIRVSELPGAAATEERIKAVIDAWKKGQTT